MNLISAKPSLLYALFVLSLHVLSYLLQTIILLYVHLKYKALTPFSLSLSKFKYYNVLFSVGPSSQLKAVLSYAFIVLSTGNHCNRLPNGLPSLASPDFNFFSNPSE